MGEPAVLVAAIEGPAGDRRGALRGFAAEVAPPTLLAAVAGAMAGGRRCQRGRGGDAGLGARGVVTVACRSAVWASELTMLASALLGA